MVEYDIMPRGTVNHETNSYGKWQRLFRELEPDQEAVFHGTPEELNKTRRLIQLACRWNRKVGNIDANYKIATRLVRQDGEATLVVQRI